MNIPSDTKARIEQIDKELAVLQQWPDEQELRDALLDERYELQQALNLLWQRVMAQS